MLTCAYVARGARILLHSAWVHSGFHSIPAKAYPFGNMVECCDNIALLGRHSLGILSQKQQKSVPGRFLECDTCTHAPSRALGFKPRGTKVIKVPFILQYCGFRACSYVLQVHPASIHTWAKCRSCISLCLGGLLHRSHSTIYDIRHSFSNSSLHIITWLSNFLRCVILMAWGCFHLLHDPSSHPPVPDYANTPIQMVSPLDCPRAQTHVHNACACHGMAWECYHILFDSSSHPLSWTMQTRLYKLSRFWNCLKAQTIVDNACACHVVGSLNHQSSHG
jgi:hypothetical protein